MQWLESNDWVQLRHSYVVSRTRCERWFAAASRAAKPHAEAFESSVLSVIEKTIQDGVANDRLTAILHQIELHQREVTGDEGPYGLNLMLRALGLRPTSAMRSRHSISIRRSNDYRPN